jgi:hypothetical protein
LSHGKIACAKHISFLSALEVNEVVASHALQKQPGLVATSCYTSVMTCIMCVEKHSPLADSRVALVNHVAKLGPGDGQLVIIKAFLMSHERGYVFDRRWINRLVADKTLE